jgi:hypothetical protein
MLPRVVFKVSKEGAECVGVDRSGSMCSSCTVFLTGHPQTLASANMQAKRSILFS